MYNRIIEQLVEKINTKYCHLNDLFQAPGVLSLTAELRREALGSRFPASSTCFCNDVGGRPLRVFSRHLDMAALGFRTYTFSVFWN